MEMRVHVVSCACAATGASRRRSPSVSPGAAHPAAAAAPDSLRAGTPVPPAPGGPAAGDVEEQHAESRGLDHKHELTALPGAGVYGLVVRDVGHYGVASCNRDDQCGSIMK